MIGQINLGDVAGNLIYEIVSRNDVKNIVEIGTWNGMGSTLCVIKAIIDSGSPKRFQSIELYPDMFELATRNLQEKTLKNNFGQDINCIDYVELLQGRIIEFEEVFWFDHSKINFNTCEHARTWYYQDMNNLKNSENIFPKISDKIDFLILDGGEYTTYPEWIRLKDRTTIVALDDSAIHKCSRIRQEIIESNQYETIFDNLSQRNGFSLFKKK